MMAHTHTVSRFESMQSVLRYTYPLCHKDRKLSIVTPSHVAVLGSSYARMRSVTDSLDLLQGGLTACAPRALASSIDAPRRRSYGERLFCLRRSRSNVLPTCPKPTSCPHHLRFTRYPAADGHHAPKHTSRHLVSLLLGIRVCGQV